MHLGAALLEIATAQLLEAVVAEVSSRAIRRVVDQVAGEEQSHPSRTPGQLALPLATVFASSVRSHVPGRVRLHVPAIRGDRRAATSVEARLVRTTGVRRAVATIESGNVLVEYDPARITLGRIRAAIEPTGRTRPPAARRRTPDGRQLALAV